MHERNWTPEDMMTIAAARQVRNRVTCFVGVGVPSVAACLAKSMHAADVILVYESGAIGAKPPVAPLSIADYEVAETADLIVGVQELFSYWLQGGRIATAFISTAQIDRFGNLNSTVVGDYRQPKVRLPGAGGAPEIALSSQEVFVVVRQNPKSFVEKLDFLTTEGCRANLRAVITDLGILRPQQDTRELVLVAYHPGVSLDEIRAATGWPLKAAETLEELPPPTASELAALHDLHRKTRETHELPARSLRGVSAPAGS